MSNVNEIKKSVKFLQKNGLKKTKISLLHCNTEYPTPLSDVNLLVIKNSKKYLNAILVFLTILKAL